MAIAVQTGREVWVLDANYRHVGYLDLAALGGNWNVVDCWFTLNHVDGVQSAGGDSIPVGSIVFRKVQENKGRIKVAMTTASVPALLKLEAFTSENQISLVTIRDMQKRAAGEWWE